MPSQLQVASGVGEQVYAGIRTYAAGLGDAKTKMEAQRFTGIGCHMAVNTAAEAVNTAEAHLALAVSAGNPAAISVAQANLKMCEVTYTQAVAEWDACLAGADSIKAELLEVTTRAAGQVTSVVKASTEGAVACVDPSGLSPYFQVNTMELDTVAQTADQVAELVAAGMNQITSLVGADEISGDVITQAVEDTRSTWKYAAAKLMEDIQRIGRQAVMFAQLYAEHDQYSTSLFDPITVMMRGMFRSILEHPADDVMPAEYMKQPLKPGVDAYEDVSWHDIYDPSLGAVVPAGELIADMRMMRAGANGDPKARQRNILRKTNTEAFLMANGQLPLSDGVTSKMITPPADRLVGMDAGLRQSHVSPLGNPYQFNSFGVPVAVGEQSGVRVGLYPADGTVLFDTPDGGYEKVFPRPPYGSTMQPYQTYERWNPVTNTTTQQITYSNGMVIENIYPGKNPDSTKAIVAGRGLNAIQPETPLAATWHNPLGNTINIQDTPLSPVATYELPEPPTYPQPRITPETAWKYANPAATAAGGAAAGINTGQHIDEAANYIKPLKRLGIVGDGITLYQGAKGYMDTGQYTPVTEAAGSVGGGFLGGMAGGAIAGTFTTGPLGTAIGGAIGALAGSEALKEVGHELGKNLDE